MDLGRSFSRAEKQQAIAFVVLFAVGVMAIGVGSTLWPETQKPIALTWVAVYAVVALVTNRRRRDEKQRIATKRVG